MVKSNGFQYEQLSNCDEKNDGHSSAENRRNLGTYLSFLRNKLFDQCLRGNLCTYLSFLRNKPFEQCLRGNIFATYNQKINLGRKNIYVGLIVSVFLLLLLYQSALYSKPEAITVIMGDEPPISSSSTFLIFNSKCRIVNIDPYNKEVEPFVKRKKYISCTDKPLLTSFANVNESLVLTINKQVGVKYAKTPISCCYSEVARDEKNKEKDCCVTLSKCIAFDNSTVVKTPTVMVKCTEKKTYKEIYKNVHSAIKFTESVKAKMNKTNSPKRPISVLFIGIDSVSRLNFIRSLPKTKQFVEQHQFIEMHGYNKIGDNTFPNLMAIFTGKNESKAYAQCNPKNISGIDKCSMIWHKYEKHNYITAYSEDAASISTFNYLKKGFTRAPTDYYFRPYILAAEKLKIKPVDTLAYCTGPESSGERILNTARDFTKTFIDFPTFGFFWMNTFSHNEVNTVSVMDEKIKDFFEYIANIGVLNDTMIVFLSDHGIRFGKIRLTQTGWYEERLPFIYFSIPKRFQEDYPAEYKHLLINSKRLTTPYDLYVTLQDFLIIQGLNTTMDDSSGCPNCSSLFGNLPRDRSCQDASINSHWCTCKPFTTINETIPLVNKSAEFILNYIQNEVLKNNIKCAKYTLNRVLHAKTWNDTTGSSNTTLLLVFETKPDAFFEATITARVVSNEIVFDFDGNISRLDSYSAHSQCEQDSNLKKYCYCR